MTTLAVALGVVVVVCFVVDTLIRSVVDALKGSRQREQLQRCERIGCSDPNCPDLHDRRPLMGRKQAADLAERISVYLLGRGWYRDGDDPGIWIKDGHGSVGLTDALAVQLVADGVKWPAL